MGLNAALVDLGRKIGAEPTPRKVEGSTQFAPVTTEWFKCRLTLGTSTQRQDDRRGRPEAERRPTLIAALRDRAGVPVSITANDKIEVRSRQLGTSTWQITGDPEPIRKKRRVIGFIIPLARVDEHPFAKPIDQRTVA